MLKRDISKALLQFKTEQVTGRTRYLKIKLNESLKVLKTNESLQEKVFAVPN